jgi:hypothetical protein
LTNFRLRVFVDKIKLDGKFLSVSAMITSLRESYIQVSKIFSVSNCYFSQGIAIRTIIPVEITRGSVDLCHRQFITTTEPGATLLSCVDPKIDTLSS